MYVKRGDNIMSEELHRHVHKHVLKHQKAMQLGLQFIKFDSLSAEFRKEQAEKRKKVGYYEKIHSFELDEFEISVILDDRDRMADPREWEKVPSLVKRNFGKLVPSAFEGKSVFKPTKMAKDIALVCREKNKRKGN